MIARLSGPVAFLDIEATGTDRENDRIVEIAITRIEPDGSRTSKCTLINPEMEIPQSAIDIHGITNEAVEPAPKFKQIAKSLLAFIDGCDLAGFNSNVYDIPMLYYEFLRAGIEMPFEDRRFFDIGNLFKIQEPRTLSAAVQFYLGRDHDGAHGAQADVDATVEVFMAQLKMYPDLPKEKDDLALYTNYGNGIVDISGKFIKNPDGIVLFNFGPNTKGKPANSDPGFLQWMVNKGTFMPDTVRIAIQILDELAAEK